MIDSMQPARRTGAQAPREPVKFLLFAASLRADSLNLRLAKLARAVMEKHGGTVDHALMSEFDGPSYNGEVEAASGMPGGPAELCRRLEANDAFVIAAPEFNASIPGLLKNAIDWASRHRPQPFNGRHAMLLSASPSMMGGNRGAWALRVPLEHLGARVYPDMFSLAQAHQAIDAAGAFASADIAARFENTLVSFMDLVEAAKHYPCAKKAWVEFLGERPDPIIDRVE